MTDEPKRNMPQRKYIGSFANYCLGEVLYNYQEHADKPDRIMGYKIPYWQRDLVWTQEQNIRFVESLWYQLPVGSYIFNRSHDNEDLDDVLLDGQQRMNALQLYLQNSFPVLGFHWAETTKVDRAFFRNAPFSAYVSTHKTVEDMKEIYNLMNFSGTPHLESDYAKV